MKESAATKSLGLGSCRKTPGDDPSETVHQRRGPGWIPGWIRRGGNQVHQSKTMNDVE